MAAFIFTDRGALFGFQDNLCEIGLVLSPGGFGDGFFVAADHNNFYKCQGDVN